MRLSSGISGILVGLIFGALLGGALLSYRYGLFSELAGQDGLAGKTERTSGRNQGQPSTSSISNDDSVRSSVDRIAAGNQLYNQRTNAIVRATKQVAPAVVSINIIRHVPQNRDPSMEFMEQLGIIPNRDYYSDVQSMGSGVIISSDGMVLSNTHVVEGADQVIVTLSDGRQFAAKLLDSVDRYDLVVLKIEGENLPVAHLSEDDDVQIGEWAIAIGSPFGYLLADTQPTVTVGVVSALNRDIRRNEGERRTYLGMIQTDAAINPGNSGGPLVNIDGEVIGINTFIFSQTGGSVGIGFAVPAWRVRSVVDDIRQYGHFRESNLGITVRAISPGMMRLLKLTDPIGLMVYAVVPGSPAWMAGLRPRDILRKIGDVNVGDFDAVVRLTYDAQVGDELSFTAERDGVLRTGVMPIFEW